MSSTVDDHTAGHHKPEVDTSNEEYMLEPVPRAARRSWLSMFVIWVGFGYVPTGLIVGGQLAGQGGAPGMNWPMALSTIVVGQGFLVLLTFALGYPAMKAGLNLSLISRYSYGKKGIMLPMIIMAFLTLGWFALTRARLGASTAAQQIR